MTVIDLHFPPINRIVYAIESNPIQPVRQIHHQYTCPCASSKQGVPYRPASTNRTDETMVNTTTKIVSRRRTSSISSTAMQGPTRRDRRISLSTSCPFLDYPDEWIQTWNHLLALDLNQTFCQCQPYRIGRKIRIRTRSEIERQTARTKWTTEKTGNGKIDWFAPIESAGNGRQGSSANTSHTVRIAGHELPAQGHHHHDKDTGRPGEPEG